MNLQSKTNEKNPDSLQKRLLKVDHGGLIRACVPLPCDTIHT